MHYSRLLVQIGRLMSSEIGFNMKALPYILIGGALLGGALLLSSKNKEKVITEDVAGVSAVVYTQTGNATASQNLIDYAEQDKSTGKNNVEVFNDLVNAYNDTITGATTNHIPPSGSIGLVYSQGNYMYGAGYYPYNFRFDLPAGVQGYNQPDITAPIGYTYAQDGLAYPVYKP